MVDDLQENEDIGPSSSPSIRSKINLDDLPSDPADRLPITSYHPNQIDDVRRAYLVKKVFQPRGGREVFVSGGFYNWSKPGALKEHVGEVNSIHNNSVQICDNLLNQNRSYEANVTKHSNEEKIANWYRLLGSVRFFLAVLKLICENNPDIGKYCLGIAKKNNTLTAPSIQKEIIDCFVKEVTKKLCEEFKDDVFGLLVDESSDVSQKEQMTIVMRYVDKRGVVKESLIGVAHVNNTSSATLKEAIVYLLSNNQLSIDQVMGQGYDGASNTRGKFNGLKALILRDNPSAHYIHCFAHQLQLVIVAVAKKHTGVKEFYESLGLVFNTVGASCKRKYMMLELKSEMVKNEILLGEIKTGK
ncbi:uncharacterized protein LOC143635209 [Bidens hawaiensis]|uniref:uncharacterized protein LOC143635209 n=1 Tax=Bidens hawaiensis TaxID=980011 RepID=UPI00404B0366